MTTLEKAVRAMYEVNPAIRGYSKRFNEAIPWDEFKENEPTANVYREQATAAISAALLDPSDELQEDLAEAFDAAFLPAWRACIAKHGTHSVLPAWASWGPKFLRAAGVKITGS